MNVYLVDENGKEIDYIIDTNGLISQIIPYNNEKFPLMRYIDLYGDTIYNRLQMPQILAELTIIKKTITPKEIVYILNIEALINRGLKEPHLYLKFVGD